MDWIKTKYGYVRKEAIIEVYTLKQVPGTIYLGLNNGQSTIYKEYKDDEMAEFAIAELMDFLNGRENTYSNKF